jgi:DNA protecting protein DprA
MNTLLSLHLFKKWPNRIKKELVVEYGTSEKDLQAFLNRRISLNDELKRDWESAQEKAHIETAHASREGYSILPFSSTDYPDGLKEVADPPMVLFGRGEWPARKSPLAVVGTRKPTGYGRDFCRRLAVELSAFPINFVSGLALGIDAAIHREALDMGATTTAFLAGGLKAISPKRHTVLARELVDEGGGYWTEQPFDQAPLKQLFPVRNRLIAGASMATFVVEAARRSGALITAQQAFDYGREVYALPGALFQPMSAGPNALIEQCCAQAVTGVTAFSTRFNPSWLKNDAYGEATEDITLPMMRQFSPGRKLSSLQLRMALNCDNSIVFRELDWMLKQGVLEKIGPDKYARKTV